MLGYADESGEPGVQKNEHDFFTFCIVLIENKQRVLSICDKIALFRQKQGLSGDHEFHYSMDSKKTRLNFARFLSELNFKYLAVSIKKNGLKSTATFAKMSDSILGLLEENHIDANIIMDTNPILYKELRTRKKKYNVVLRFAEKKSHSNDLIQVADYVTAIYTRFLKYPYNKSAKKFYALLASKRLGSIRK